MEWFVDREYQWKNYRRLLRKLLSQKDEQYMCADHKNERDFDTAKRWWNQ